MTVKKLKGLLALIYACCIFPYLGAQRAQAPLVSLEEIDQLLADERYEDAYPLLQDQLPYLEEGENWSNLAHVYLWLGECAYVLADYRAALDYTQTAELVVLDQIGQDSFPEFGMLLQNLGVFYSRAGDFDQQMSSYQRHFDYTISTKGQDTKEGADAYYNLGMAYLRRNQWEKTQAFLDTSLKISEELQYGTGIGDALNILAICFANKGDYAQAASVQRQALRYDLEGYNYSVKLNNLAEYQLNLKQYPAARQNFEKAIEAGPNNWGPRLNLIRLFRLQEEWEQAEKLTDQWIVQLGRDPLTWASELKRLLNYKASFYQRTEDWDSALVTLNRGLRLKAVDPTIDASLYLQLATTHLGNKDYPEALSAIQQLYRLLFPKDVPNDALEDPTVESLLNAEVALEVLTLKGRIYQGMLADQMDQDVQRAAIALYQKAEQLIQRNRERYASVASKSLLAQAALVLYQDAIELMYALHQNTGDPAWIEQALYFSERSRATSIADRLNTIQANLFTQIPAQLIAKEQELLGDIAFYNNQIASAVDQSDTELRESWEQTLFQKRKEQQALLKILKEEYPQYFDLKYQNFALDLSSVRTELVGTEEVLLEYFIGQKDIYLIWLSGEEMGIERLAPFDLIEKGIRAFRQGMLSQGPAYEEWAYRLYELLLQPIEDVIKEKSLIIIPDGVLGYVPFETLLSKPLEADGSISNANFLLWDHSVRYFFSIQVALLGQRIKQGKSANGQILGVSPGFTDSIPLYLSGEPGAEARYLAPLQGALAELEEMESRYPGSFLYGSEATKTAFWELANKHTLLHISTHTWIDDQNPNASGFLFAAGAQDSMYSFLHAYELFNQSLLADLVTLSACNTGYGQIQKGEGIASLARAFAFAGCQNLVMTLWPIRDRTTPELMRFFYGNLTDGMGKDEALYQAKKDYLQTTNPLFHHPYYWGGIIYVGDKQAVSLKQVSKISPTVYAAGAAVIALLLLLVIRRARN